MIKALNGNQCIVLIVSSDETAPITKHLISLCRASNIAHVILPKFQQQALCSMFGVKRLTCFSLISEQGWWTDLDNAEDSEFLE